MEALQGFRRFLFFLTDPLKPYNSRSHMGTQLSEIEMKKPLQNQLGKTLEALRELTSDLSMAAWAERDEGQAQTLAQMANVAAEMAEHIEQVWTYGQHKLTVLIQEKNYDAIRPLLIEVHAVKVEAARRRRDARAKEQMAIFKLGAIATYKEASHV